MRLLIALAALALIAAPAGAFDWEALAPDAALVAHTGAGETVDGAAWQVGAVAGHRAWADLIDPRGTWGLGLSADLSPGGAACAGVGWRSGLLVYYGLHF